LGGSGGRDVIPAEVAGMRPPDRSTSGGFMRTKVAIVFSNVAELGLFFVAAVALCIGLLGLR
jgi:hypothetical protein